MIKTKKLLVQTTVDDMIQKYQRELNQKRDLIIADLESKEKSLIAKVNQNPKIWNSKSVQFSLKTAKKRDLSSEISLDVTLTQVCFQKVNTIKNKLNPFQQLDETRQTEKDRKFAEELQQLELDQSKTDESREYSQIKTLPKLQ